MSAFLEAEKEHQARFKATSPWFTEAARADGLFRGRAHPFCLPAERAEENLWPGIRRDALVYFQRQQIKWHYGQDGKPINHLCGSQVCCVNHLLPFAHHPVALAELLRPACPDIERMLPIEDGQFVACEWVGLRHYLSERGWPKRGATCTSADAAVMFQRTDGKRQIVLIEWKYTEMYSLSPRRIAGSGVDRLTIYRRLLEREDGPIDIGRLPSLDVLFFEPFDQLMRQQLLAHEMEQAHELGADVVSVLHIAPAANTDFRRVTSPELRNLGTTATGVWARLLRAPERFLSMSTESLFGRLTTEHWPELGDWPDYIRARYRWIAEPRDDLVTFFRKSPFVGIDLDLDRHHYSASTSNQ